MVSKPSFDAFFHKKGKTGVLFLHGFTSSPQDYREMGNYLAKKGITAYGPVLAGHGTTPDDLNTKLWVNWFYDSVKALEFLRKYCNKIYVVGSSMGGNLAILLASRFKIDGIVLMGTGVKFKYQIPMKIIVPILRLFKDHNGKRIYHGPWKKRFGDRAHYSVIPLRAFGQILRLMKVSRTVLERVVSPTLIIQSAEDVLLTRKNAFEIFRKVKGKKRIIWVTNAYHVVLISDHKKRMFEDIHKFVNGDLI